MMVASTSVPLDDQAERIELTIRLRKPRRRKAELVDRLAKPPDRGVIGRLHLQRQATKAAERQPVAHRLLGGGITERVPLLNKQELEHHKRRIAWRSHRRALDRRKQRLQRRPVELLLDPIQKPSALPATTHHRLNERRLGQVTARHRRIILAGQPQRIKSTPLLQRSPTIPFQNSEAMLYVFSVAAGRRAFCDAGGGKNGMVN
jgi:hypothetical protein